MFVTTNVKYIYWMGYFRYYPKWWLYLVNAFLKIHRSYIRMSACKCADCRCEGCDCKIPIHIRIDSEEYYKLFSNITNEFELKISYMLLVNKFNSLAKKYNHLLDINKDLNNAVDTLQKHSEVDSMQEIPAQTSQPTRRYAVKTLRENMSYS